MDIKRYFDRFYYDLTWKSQWDDADQRLSKIVNMLGEYDTHLDIGCANGLFTKLYLEKYPNTSGWGTDISDVAIELAKENCPEGNFQQADVCHLPYGDNTFDLVHSCEIIEHLENPGDAVKECWRVLHPGGELIITVPDKNNSTYEEHPWKWNESDERVIVKSTMTRKHLKGFKILEEHPNFFNGHLMYVRCIKI